MQSSVSSLERYYVRSNFGKKNKRKKYQHQYYQKMKDCKIKAEDDRRKVEDAKRIADAKQRKNKDHVKMRLRKGVKVRKSTLERYNLT